MWLAAQWSAIASGTWEHPEDAKRREEAAQREQDLRNITLEEYARQWLQQLERRASAGTLRKRRSDLRANILPTLGDAPIASLTPRKLSQWWDNLTCGPGARKNAYETLRALLNAAVEDEDVLLDANPLRIKGGGTEARVTEKYLFTASEVDAIAAAIAKPYNALVVLLADAGLRINEALALTRANLTPTADGETLTVHVEHSLHRSGRHLTPGPTKTRAGVRRVTLMPHTTQIMRTHLNQYVKPGPDAILFPSPTGTFARDTALTKILRVALAGAGVVVPDGKSAGWHSFRHYSATRFGQAGATTRALMVRYGWSDPDMAARYQRADEEYERELVARMAAAWSVSVEG